MTTAKFDNMTEEQIQDYQEIQDSLLIPLRAPATVSQARKCVCSRCIYHCYADEPGGAHGFDEIPQLAGKVSTKLRR